MADENSRLIIHRPYEGEHEVDSDQCWCQPVVIDFDDPRTTEELVEAAKKMPN